MSYICISKKQKCSKCNAVSRPDRPKITASDVCGSLAKSPGHEICDKDDREMYQILWISGHHGRPHPGRMFPVNTEVSQKANGPGGNEDLSEIISNLIL
jgi:hypothetical protein